MTRPRPTRRARPPTATTRGPPQHGHRPAHRRTSTYSYDVDGPAQGRRTTAAASVRTSTTTRCGRLTSDTLQEHRRARCWPHRPTATTTPTGSPARPPPVRRAPGDNTYGYDQAGRLTSWTRSGTPATSTTTRATGPSRHRPPPSTTSATGWSPTATDYTYSARGTLRSGRDRRDASATSFDAFDRMITDGATTYTYDGLDRVASAAGRAFSYAGLGNDPGRRRVRGLRPGPGGDCSSPSRSRMLPTPARRRGRPRPPPTPRGRADRLDRLRPVREGRDQHRHQAGRRLPGRLDRPGHRPGRHGARWYDPGTGTFDSRDTAQYISGPSALANHYPYGAADPLTQTDPSGNWPSCGWCSSVSNSVASSYHAVTSTVSHYAGAAWSASTKAAASKVYGYAKATVTWAYNTAKSALSYVVDKISSAYNWAKDRSPPASTGRGRRRRRPPRPRTGRRSPSPPTPSS